MITVYGVGNAIRNGVGAPGIDPAAVTPGE
jgi:hypothetical protein